MRQHRRGPEQSNTTGEGNLPNPRPAAVERWPGQSEARVAMGSKTKPVSRLRQVTRYGRPQNQSPSRPLLVAQLKATASLSKTFKQPNGFALQPRGPHQEIPGQRKQRQAEPGTFRVPGQGKCSPGPRRSASACWTAQRRGNVGMSNDSRGLRPNARIACAALGQHKAH